MASCAEKLQSIVVSTYVGFSLSLCKDVGILDVLLESHKPVTSKEIADKRNLKERYVRELLGSLATAEVIHVSTNDTGSLVYYLDDVVKSLFGTQLMTSLSGPAVMIPAYDKIKSCLPKTGPHGTRFTSEFHDFIEGFTSYHLDSYVENIIKHVDGLKERLESGIEILEVGCGRGQLLAKFALMFPKSTFTASDNVDFLLDQLKDNHGHIPNMKFALLDLVFPCSLPRKQYDWVLCVNALHDVPDPPEALKNIRTVMKAPSGTFTMIDIATSGSPIGDKGNMIVACMYAASSFFCVPESSLTEGSYAMGLCYGKQRAVDFLTGAGFQVEIVDLEYPTTLYVCK